MIRYDSFTKFYGGRAAVEHLTLAVEQGEVVALLGPNGSGKTTTVNAAASLRRPSAGSVVLGVPGAPAHDPAARFLISFLPQRVAFPDSLTGREVVEFYRRLRGLNEACTDEALRFASLNGAGHRTVGTYSGGMVQRLGLAVAVLPNAPVLLLDEPTAALDPEGLCAFYGLIERRKREGGTVLFTSHQLGDAERLADRFAVLVSGRLRTVFSGRELADRLASRGVLKLRLANWPVVLLDKVRAVAPDAVRIEDQLIVPGPAALRPAVLDVVRACGAEIRGLTAEEGRLDVLYREFVEQADEEHR